MKIHIALQHLGLTTASTEADVRQAYRELVKIWHPDRFQNDERLNSRAEAQLKLINEAKTVSLAYLEKYGHFLHVTEEAPRRTQSQSSSGPEAYRRKRPQSAPEEEPKKERKKPPEPEQEKPKDPPPKEEPEPITYAAPSFQFGQNALIVVFILLVLVSFSILLFSSLKESPMERMKAYTEEPLQIDPLRKVMAERDAEKEPEVEAEPDGNPEDVGLGALLDTFFTLGSEKEWVSFVQGPPLQIKGQLWRYGHSTVDFLDNKVIGWNSSLLNPLLVGMILPSDSTYPYANFTLGSRKDEVVALQGAPSILNGNFWNFGEAIVLFEVDTVIAYKNDMSNTLYAPSITDPEILSLINSP